MKIEIKNIKINKSFSQETICFTADVFVNGIKTAYAENDGRGGCTFYSSYHKPNNDKDLKDAEAFAMTLPSVNYGSIEIKSTLETVIDEAIYAKVNEGERNRIKKVLEKHMVTDICVGVPNGDSYRRIGYGKKPLKAVCLTNRPQVQALVDRIRGDLKTGEVILNTNLAELGLK